MKKQANEAIQRRKPVKGRTCVERIVNLDVGKFVYAEYMHGGVVKMFIHLCLEVPGPWNLKVHANKIDEFVESLKSSFNFIGRIMKPFSKYSHWKARELRMWLLPAKYVQHWMLLVTAIFLLPQDEIPMRDIDRAEVSLKLFVRDIGTLYRLQDYSYNVHQLLHLPLYVRRRARYGPHRRFVSKVLTAC